MLGKPEHMKFLGGILVGLLLGQLLLVSCLKEITLEVPERDSGGIAIRGALIKAEQPYILVKITNVTNFKASDIPQPVVGATVILANDKGEKVVLAMRKDGEYFLDLSLQMGKLELIAGNAYQVIVTTPAGQTYQSSWETLNPVPEPNFITQVSETRTILNEVGNTVDQEFLRFFITTPILNPENGSGVYLKWDFSGVYRVTESTIDVPLPPVVKTCYIEEVLNLENVVVFNGQERRTEVLEDFFLLEEPYNYRFYEGYYLTVRQQSLSEGAFRYWDQIGEVVNRNGNFFESPAGKVKGNFHNTANEREEVFGYFYVSEETTLRYRVQPGQDRIFPLCPSLIQPDESGVNYLCFDCLDHPNGSLEKPAYWVD